MVPIPAIPKVLGPGRTMLDFSGLSTVRKKPGNPGKPTYKVLPGLIASGCSSQYENQLDR